MKIRILRNATLLLTLGAHRLVVDPMLGAAGTLPGFKLFGGGRRRNPLVELPAEAERALMDATGALITHAHPDHLDGAGKRWLRERRLPVWAHPRDAAALRRAGIDARDATSEAIGFRLELVPVVHGRGVMRWLMGRVHGMFLAHPGEPSVLLTSDAVLDDALIEALERLRPDVVVAPAGAANMGVGGDILFSVDELVTLAKRAPGQVVLNHLEALDHCPTTRTALRARLAAEGLSPRAFVPDDGAEVAFEAPARTQRGLAAQG